MGGNGFPSDVTDNTLTSVLVVLDRFKRAVLGNALPRDDISGADSCATPCLPTGAGSPALPWSILIRQILPTARLPAARKMTRRTEPVRVVAFHLRRPRGAWGICWGFSQNRLRARETSATAPPKNGLPQKKRVCF